MSTTEAYSHLDQPFVMVIMGATGDLTKRKLLPALYHLWRAGELKQPFQILAFARRPLDSDGYIEEITPSIADNYRHDLDNARWQEFSRHIHYIQGKFDANDGYETIKASISALNEKHSKVSFTVLYYLATNPSAYATIFKRLASAQLDKPLFLNDPQPRIIIEKPFGSDLTTARQLNQLLLSLFAEDQIYRIDHYLGKESVQNILAFRFANHLFEPTWTNAYIDNIQITVAETLGVENRGDYYDMAGALRDVGQNHILQLLALVAMEQPASLEPQHIRKAKSAVLSRLSMARDNRNPWVHGQYDGGVIDGKVVAAYRQEPKVAAQSTTGTYIAMKLELDVPRWRGVPFYVRTGKRMAERVTEIVIEYRRSAGNIFGQAQHTVTTNLLRLRIQPDEGISLRMAVKEPGLAMRLYPTDLHFQYADAFGDTPDAYERLLLDAIIGDQSLFLGNEEVESSWSSISPALLEWDNRSQPAMYRSGSWGPEEADELLERDGRKWN